MLRIEHISKTFSPGTPNEHKALDDISLHLKPGDFVTVIGSNGAGKSTLFNAVAGNFFPDAGRIYLDGEDITYKKEHIRAHQIGRLFQDPMKGTAPHMTIEENLALVYYKAGISPFAIAPRKKDAAMFRELLASLDMGLEDRMHAKMGLLSGGQRQAVTLLMSTIVTPKLLLLDEHTAALDPLTAEKVLKLTEKITAEKQLTTMMVTHNIQSALKQGNRTIMLDAGKIVIDLSAEERRGMGVADLMDLYRKQCSREMNNDRMLLS